MVVDHLPTAKAVAFSEREPMESLRSFIADA
jgi:hypothetical protein